MGEWSVMQTQTQPSRLTRWWHSWVSNFSGRTELERLGNEEIDILARDVGTSTSELRALAGRWPDSANLLARRMAMLKLDLEETRSMQPGVARDLEEHCSLCDAQARCEHDLDRGSVKPAWRRYCPNATTLMALVAGRRAGVGPT